MDEHPLVVKDFEHAKTYFGRLKITYFHLTSLAAVPFRQRPWFSSFLIRLDKLDQALFHRFPRLRKHVWAAAIVLSEPRKTALAVPQQFSGASRGVPTC